MRMKMNIDLFPGDTHHESAKIQLEVLRKMDISQRAEMTFQLSDNLRSIVIAGIRQRHPDYTEEEIIKAVLSLSVDKETIDKAFANRETSA